MRELSKEKYLEMCAKAEGEKRRAEQRFANFEKQMEDRTNLSFVQEEGQLLLTNIIKRDKEFLENWPIFLF